MTSSFFFLLSFCFFDILKRRIIDNKQKTNYSTHISSISIIPVHEYSLREENPARRTANIKRTVWNEME
jgi:hypothetical protein